MPVLFDVERMGSVSVYCGVEWKMICMFRRCLFGDLFSSVPQSVRLKFIGSEFLADRSRCLV